MKKGRGRKEGKVLIKDSGRQWVLGDWTEKGNGGGINKMRWN